MPPAAVPESPLGEAEDDGNDAASSTCTDVARNLDAEFGDAAEDEDDGGRGGDNERVPDRHTLTRMKSQTETPARPVDKLFGDRGTISAAAAPMPPPKANLVVDGEFDVSPQQMHRLLFHPDSAFYADLVARRGLTSLQVGPWKPDGGDSNNNDVFVRNLTYVAYGSGVLAAGYTTHETQRSARVAGGGFAVECIITTPGVPFGSQFESRALYSIKAGDATEGARLRLSYEIVFVKAPPGFVRSLVVAGAVKGMATYVKQVMDELVPKHCARIEIGPTVSPPAVEDETFVEEAADLLPLQRLSISSATEEEAQTTQLWWRRTYDYMRAIVSGSPAQRATASARVNAEAARTIQGTAAGPSRVGESPSASDLLHRRVSGLLSHIPPPPLPPGFALYVSLIAAATTLAAFGSVYGTSHEDERDADKASRRQIERLAAAAAAASAVLNGLAQVVLAGAFYTIAYALANATVDSQAHNAVSSPRSIRGGHHHRRQASSDLLGGDQLVATSDASQSPAARVRRGGGSSRADGIPESKPSTAKNGAAPSAAPPTPSSTARTAAAAAGTFTKAADFASSTARGLTERNRRIWSSLWQAAPQETAAASTEDDPKTAPTTAAPSDHTIECTTAQPQPQSQQEAHKLAADAATSPTATPVKRNKTSETPMPGPSPSTPAAEAARLALERYEQTWNGFENKGVRRLAGRDDKRGGSTSDHGATRRRPKRTHRAGSEPDGGDNGAAAIAEMNAVAPAETGGEPDVPAAYVLEESDVAFLRMRNFLSPEEEGNASHARLCEVWENQRMQPWSGWGSTFPGHLLPTDRGRYSTRDGSVHAMHFRQVAPRSPPWDGFEWAPGGAWEVDLSALAWGGVDHHGWSYGVDMWVYSHPPPPGSGSCRWNQLTRRRRWVRVAIRRKEDGKRNDETITGAGSHAPVQEERDEVQAGGDASSEAAADHAAVRPQQEEGPDEPGGEATAAHAEESQQEPPPPVVWQETSADERVAVRLAVDAQTAHVGVHLHLV